MTRSTPSAPSPANRLEASPPDLVRTGAAQSDSGRAHGGTGGPASADPIAGPCDTDDHFPELDDFTPVPRRSNRHDGWSEAAQREFIKVLALTGKVTVAARAVGKTRVTAYRLRKSRGAEGFARAWDIAEEMGRQNLRDLAYQRAVEGEQRPVYRGGRLIGYRTVYDNRLLMRLMQVAKPDTYNRQHHYPGAPVPEEFRAAYAALGGAEAVDAALKAFERDLAAAERAIAQGAPLPASLAALFR